MYKRLLAKNIKNKFFKGKILIIVGARQTGKTTLSLDLIKSIPQAKTIIFNCDNPTDREQLANKNLDYLKQLMGDNKVIFIDEAQKVENIGQTLKLLVDYYKNKKQIIVTGSSSFNLLHSTQEPLTGRKYVFRLFPLSLEEIYPDKNYLKLIKGLESLMIFGCYPEVVSQRSFVDKKELVKELSLSYIYKDVLGFQEVKGPDVLARLLKSLALQIGSQVSYNELSNTVQIDKKTIERYIDILEKNHIIFKLNPYTKNKRREISKLKKIYFYDTGIRNAIINNFNFTDSRNDTGALWENFIISERMKFLSYHKYDRELYFWRTYDGNEIDLIEEESNRLCGYEIKLSPLKKNRKKKDILWLDSYKLISKENLKGFVF